MRIGKGYINKTKPRSKPVGRGKINHTRRLKTRFNTMKTKLTRKARKL